MKTVLIHTMYTVLLASLLYMNIVQARTITNQQHEKPEETSSESTPES
jgi:hypothetical protein